MKELQRFVRRQARRAQALPRLEEALLLDRGAAYAAYRLRFLVLRVPLRTALHVMEVVLFASVIWPEYLSYFLFLRSGGAIANGLWWGALEALRGEVRADVARRRGTRARTAIERWLGASLWLQLVLGAALLAYLRWAPTPFSSFSILDLYAIAVFARLSMDVFSRAYHAGVYAYRRVYRPLWSLVLGDLADVLAVAALFGAIGPWAFAPALLFGGVVKNGLTLWFTARAYRDLPWLRPRLAAALRPARLPRVQLARAARFALANLSGQLDAWIVVALTASALEGGRALALAALFHVLRPVLAAGAGWSRLFYFDYKRLERETAGLLRRRFDRMLRRVALSAGASVAGLLVAASFALPALRLPVSLLPWLLFFMLARSYFGLRQLEAFVDARMRVLIAQSAISLIAMFAVVALSLPAAGALALLGAGLALASWMGGRGGATPPPLDPSRPLPLLDWIELLHGVPGPLRLGVAQVDRALSPPRRVARACASWLGDAGAVARPQGATLLWFERVHGAAERVVPEQPDRLPLALFAGTLRARWLGPSCDDGAAALAAARSAGVLPPAVDRVLSDTPQARARRLSALREAHPAARVLDLEGRGLVAPPGVARRELAHQVLRALSRARDGQMQTRLPGLELIALGPCGPVVALPRHARPPRAAPREP